MEQLERLLDCFSAFGHTDSPDGDKQTDEEMSHILKTFKNFEVALNEMAEHEFSNHQLLENNDIEEVQRALKPLIALTTNANRWLTKPHGYPGDFLTIDMVYDNKEEGTTQLGRIVDRCFLMLSATKAVQNRRSLLRDQILESIVKNRSQTTYVASFGCGPAREIFDVYQILEDPSLLKCSLIDSDPAALEFVQNKLEALELKPFVSLIQGNVLRFSFQRMQSVLQDQDLAYSIGLIDYFSDRAVMKFMNFVHAILKPGGRIILGNFHPNNPSKAVMEHLLDWPLIYRKESDLNHMFEMSNFQQGYTNIFYEDEGINLFAECVKKIA